MGWGPRALLAMTVFLSVHSLQEHGLLPNGPRNICGDGACRRLVPLSFFCQTRCPECLRAEFHRVNVPVKVVQARMDRVNKVRIVLSKRLEERLIENIQNFIGDDLGELHPSPKWQYFLMGAGM